MTIEPTPTLSAHDARLLTQRIQLVAGNAREALEKLHVLVEQARSGGAHAVLGFASWTDYLSSTLGESPMRLDREQRRELVAYLAGEGMSTRAIAPIAGVDQKTVRNDLRAAGEEKSSPAATLPTPIHGRDGKTYVRPEPKSDRAAQAVESYPELQHYRDKGDDKKAVMLADALNGMDADEQTYRRQMLANTIAADQRKASDPPPEPTVDVYALADRVFDAANAATKAIRIYGHRVAEAMPSADPLAIANWHAEFSELARLATELAQATRPGGLRVVK